MPLTPTTPPDFIVRVKIENHPVRFFVHKRPHVDFFLSKVRGLPGGEGDVTELLLDYNLYMSVLGRVSYRGGLEFPLQPQFSPPLRKLVILYSLIIKTCIMSYSCMTLWQCPTNIFPPTKKSCMKPFHWDCQQMLVNTLRNIHSKWVEPF